MTYNKEARIAELKAMPKEELIALAESMGIKTMLQTRRKVALLIEAREFSDLRTAQKIPHIREIF